MVALYVIVSIVGYALLGWVSFIVDAAIEEKDHLPGLLFIAWPYLWFGALSFYVISAVIWLVRHTFGSLLRYWSFRSITLALIRRLNPGFQERTCDVFE